LSVIWGIIETKGETAQERRTMEANDFKCDRCGKEDCATTMSMFNTDTLCMDCKAKERKHPGYEKARKAESNALLKGDYNFPGIGKPVDL
jgi:hypothetical protein